MALHTLGIWLWLPLILLCPLLLLRKKTRGKNQLPPSPPKLPILGNLLQLGALPHQSLWQLSKKYGPVMSVKLGYLPAVIISSADAAREVLKTHDLACCSRPPFVGAGRLTYNYSDMAFAPYGDYWRQLRKICVLELFSLKRVRSFQSIREEEVAALMNSIFQSATSSTPVDLNQKLFSLTASIIFRIAFGRSFKGSTLHHDKFHEMVHEMEAIMGGFSAEEYFPYVGWIIDRLTGRKAWIDRVFHKMDSFFEQVIEDRIESGSAEKDQEDIVDSMLRLQRDQTEQWTISLTRESIKGVLLNVFLAGIDTGALTVIWAIAELIRKPELMRKAQGEVRNYIGNKGRVSEGDTENLPYLNMIIKETLRLHPPAPLMLPREVMSHFKINDYNIYPKTFLQVNAWGIGRDPNYWKDPEEFIPERFEDGSIDFKGQNFEFLPFGAGRRICPGINMGTTTVELALANLLYCFDWKLPNGLEEEALNMEESVGRSLTVSKKTGLTLVPVNYLESLPVDNKS
ncbi:hypothetical protein HS088_TW06G00707 [Tripterygium wilfordii]|uniref:Cytochrome P450 71B34-like n=1 Tax=Tripterygium wilfordii TaxID=458696 RepID=A0A7J7DKD7_TRIWF|nr:cytochrome P450 71B37-like [Tripterygium wilfordii]KAF5746536.1 hypothetical protein HS088_TW06G00707 [Tripterygium wilfordii]